MIPLGDDNPIYSDPDHEATRARGGVVAPPTFVAAGAQFDPEWPWRPQPGEPWMGSGSGPGSAAIPNFPYTLFCGPGADRAA